MAADPAETSAALLHILFGTMWVGGGLFALLVNQRVAKTARSVGEFKVFQSIAMKMGPFFILSSILTLVSGIALMRLKYGWDIGEIWGSDSGKLVLVSLVIVAWAIVEGLVVNGPTAIKLSKLALPADAGAPISPEAIPLVKRLSMEGIISVVLVVVVLVMMVVAGHLE